MLWTGAWTLAIATTLPIGIGPASGDVEDLAPRVPIPKPDVPPQMFAEGFDHRLSVKFHDAVRARSEAGRLVSLAGQDLAPLLAALDDGRDTPVVFRPLIDLPRVDLDRIEREAAQHSGRAQPDLSGMFFVETADLHRAAAVLHASNLVEIAYFEPLGMPPPGSSQASNGCFDVAPFTDAYCEFQVYRGQEYGIGMDAAWALPGGRGQGVRVADCEYGYRDQHEDLCKVTCEPGVEVHPSVYAYGWHEHGTAVLGQMVGGDNGYGVTGLVPDAQASFFHEWTVTGRRRVEAITAAIASVDAGDVVLLEMQIFGAGGSYGPAELDPMVWIVTRLGVDRGVCVVAAAGNGNQNLDSDPYAEYMARGDSGAIIVGAGTADRRRDKLGFSTFGSRVDVQAWGESVFTAGYGDFVAVGGDADQSYTALFSGTSSASPIVASAVVSLQGIYRAANGVAMDPSQVRQLLVETGKAQGSGGHIGPLPDMAAAVGRLSNPSCRVDLDLDGELTVFDFLFFQTAFETQETVADFDGDGLLTILDFLAFQNGFDSGCP